MVIASILTIRLKQKPQKDDKKNTGKQIKSLALWLVQVSTVFLNLKSEYGHGLCKYN